MGQNFTLQPSPIRTSHLVNSPSGTGYAQGEWLPSLTFNGASTGITYLSRAGTYTKIGRSVTAHFRFVLTSKGSATGVARVFDLPFVELPISGSFNHMAFGFRWSSTATNLYAINAIISNNWITFSAVKAAGTGSGSALTDADFTDDTDIGGQVTYETY